MSIDPVPIQAKYKSFHTNNKLCKSLKERNRKKAQKNNVRKKNAPFQTHFSCIAYANFFLLHIIFFQEMTKRPSIVTSSTMSREHMRVGWHEIKQD